MRITNKTPQYSYYIFWSDEDKGFVAAFVELPGLSGVGPTVVNAIEELNVALEAWAETAREENFEVPEPVQAEFPFVAIDRSFMGQYTIITDLSEVLPEKMRKRTTSETMAPISRLVWTADSSQELSP